MDERSMQKAFHFICLGAFLVVFCEATHIPAYPKMLENFGLGPGFAVYMQLGFAVGLTGFQPLMGWVGDNFGQKRVLLFGAVLMAIGSILIAMAPIFWVLVAGLFFKGMSGAAIIPAGVAFAGRYFKGEKRGKALGIFTFYSTVGALIAPLASGMLVDRVGWASVFWLCMILGLIAFGLFMAGVPAIPGVRTKHFDFKGVLLVLIILASLLTIPSFINNSGLASMQWVPSLLIFVTAFIVLLLVEKKQKEPLLDIDYAKTRNFWVPSVIAICMFITFSGILFVLTFFIQNVQGKSSTMVGLLEMPLFFMMAIANLVSGKMMANSTARTMMGISIGSLVSGVAMLIFTNPSTSFIYLFVSMCLVGAGMGMVGPVIRAIIVSKAEFARVGVVSFTYLTIENLASRVGASFAIVMFAIFAANGNAVGALANTALALVVVSSLSFIFLFLIPKKVEGFKDGKDITVDIVVPKEKAINYE